MEFITPDWPAPAGVRAASTLRTGGVSPAPKDSLNLAAHVGDDPAHVTENRRRLHAALALPAEPFWLEQVHGARVVDLGSHPVDRKADASIAAAAGQVCAIMTADCLPVIFATADGRKVAAAHAGWRGLAGGVLEATVAALETSPDQIIAWLGPAISQENFEVGPEVREAFMRLHPAAGQAFVQNGNGKWQADLYRLARQHLSRAGLTEIHGGGRCTFREKESFFSHRRDPQSGRMATLIWIEKGS